MSVVPALLLDVVLITCALAVILRAPMIADFLVRRDETSPFAGVFPWRISARFYRLYLRAFAGVIIYFAGWSLMIFARR